jgi:cell division septation protein DedD
VRAQAASVLVLLAAAPAAAGQQGSIQLSTETALVQGDPQRRATERTYQPDFGISFLQPGSRVGQFQLEVRGTRRGDEVHLGRTFVAVRDARSRGITWTLEGGDLHTTPALGDYQFSNLSAASITFSGGAVTAKTRRTTTQIAAGQSTAWRNIFGTDPDTLAQSLALARMTYRQSARVQLNARAARVRTSNLKEFAKLIDASEQAGGGTRFLLTPSIHLVADGSFVRYRATGAAATVDDVSYVTGAHVLLSRGWVQIDRSRFSPGDFPVVNASLRDRNGLFAAGEYDVFSRVRVFGGWETIDTNINASGTSLLRPQATADRGFGGMRVRVGTRSTVAVRIEDGGRVSRPAVRTLPQQTTVPSTSDTGVLSAELQSTIGKLTVFGRYSRRENVDSSFSSSTFTQRDTAGQAFLNVSRGTQFFGVATLTNQRAASGSGSTFLQLTGGGQQQVFRQGLWLRAEGTVSRNRDLTTGLLAPRNAVNVGLNGQISPQTTIGFNVYVDRAPVGFPSEKETWLARSTLRLVHSIPTGTARVASATSVGARTARGTGSVFGTVFADWNANGHPDPGEGTLAGIPVALGILAHVTTARDGEFAFLNVPAGAQHVQLDLTALPVDFDPPVATDIVVELARGDTRRVAFGLIPLGGIHGRVAEDTNRNGQLDPGEPPVEGAVLTLDGGQRSELARSGAFRFDAVRSGNHQVELLKESLPEGATIVGGSERPARITREQPQVDVTYVVTIEKRPEVRKVFPPKGGGGASPLVKASPAPSKRPLTATRAESSAPHDGGIYTIQIAALNDSVRARALVAELKAAGFAAYLVEPSAADRRGPYRVRVGRYATRAAASQMAVRLASERGTKLWVTTTR